MSITLTALQHPLRIDKHGTIRVGPTRITLDTVIGAYLRGDTPELIAEGFPDLPLGDIYSSIAYYLAHKTEMDAYLAERERQGEELRLRIEADPKNRQLKEKLRAIKNAQTAKAS